ncbi:protein masquerade-like [Oppia nitens]|uniref:protein masquerade-like n=1 Tax=Oppia nitens TaxID=1686743 RepID=UPI0023DCB284|nr:protein masquerade-like [Oppia nitens]
MAELFTLFVAITGQAIVTAIIVNGQSDTNETGILSDLWSSLTSVGKAPACPGECVHAITSIFCDNVLEEVTCGANFLRCCVPHEFSFGTPVETSAPIGDNSNVAISSQTEQIKPQTTPLTTTTTTTTTPKPTESQAITSHPLVIKVYSPKPFIPPLVFGSINVNKHNLSVLSPTITTSTTTTTTTTTKPLPISGQFGDIVAESQSSQSSVNTMDQLCPGVCIKTRYIRFCGNILSNGKCPDEDHQCCLQSEVDFDNSSNVVTLVQQSDVLNNTKNIIKIDEVIEATNSSKDSIAITSSTSSTSTTTTTPMPLCEGTCVAPLFSLLCDETDYSLYCPNGGSCCINKEPTTEAPPIKPCPGKCMPTILSGMCNRPSELILKTLDCNSGTICCYNSYETDDKTVVNPEEDYGEKPNIPIHSSNTNQNIPQNFNPLLFSSVPENILPPFYGQESQSIVPQSPPSHLRPPLGHISPPQHPITHSGSMIPHINPLPTNIQHMQHLGPKNEIPIITSLSPSSPIPEPEIQAVDNSSSDSKSILVGGPPFCPGPCIAPMFKFTCFGGNAIYPKFQCSKTGQICCAAMTDIQTFEANVLANNGVWMTSNNQNKTTNYDDSPIKPPPPRRPNPYMCGIKGTQRKETPRVVGGSDSYPGEWCWQTALINSQNQYLCGGTLISAQWVLSAAHCITNLVRNGETIYVRVGDHDLTSQVGSRGAQTQKVSTTYIHHNHNGQTLDNDIALLKLESPVEFNENVCLVCLPARGSKRKPGKRCTVTGYGYKDETGPIALRIREAEVPIVDDQECTVRVNSVTEKLFILPASSFCAGGDEGNDACQGDGGSGLVCEVDNYYELTGLVSWGFGCGRSGVPGVYVKVSAFVGWINQIISVNNQ